MPMLASVVCVDPAGAMPAVAASSIRSSTQDAVKNASLAGRTRSNSSSKRASVTAASDANRPKRESGATATSVRFEICVDALMNGCVDAFVQTFTIAHRPPVCVDQLAQTMFSVPDEALPWVQERLITAELARRRSDFRRVVEARMELAQYFEQHSDTAQAVAEHQAALAAASDSLDRSLERECHENIALLYERLHALPEAVTNHEACVRLAEVSDDRDIKQRAAMNLVRVYMQQGDVALHAGRYDDAQSFLEKAVDIAKNGGGDPETEAKAYAALGNVTVLKGDLKKALEYQQRFLVVSREAHDGHSESIAALEVGKLHDSLGESNEAITALKRALKVAEENKDMVAINETCKQLGITFRNMGDSIKSAHYFRQHFKVSQDIGDLETVENARILLGFADGDIHFSQAGNRRGFLSVVCDDLESLLGWMSKGEL